jgi:hypothetical protein
MEVPRSKVVVNIGVEALDNAKALDAAVADVTDYGRNRHHEVRRASLILNCERGYRGQSDPGERMRSFLDRLINIAYPQAIFGDAECLDGRGNYTLGLRDVSSFRRSSTTKSIKSGYGSLNHHFSLNRRLVAGYDFRRDALGRKVNRWQVHSYP